MAKKASRKSRGRNTQKSTARRRGRAASARRARAGSPKRTKAGAKGKRSRAAAPKAARRPKAGRAAPKRATRAKAGRERTLAQTPAAGRTRRGPTNPMPTKRSTGTAAGAGSTRRAPALERARKQLREVEETLPTPPSSLNMDRRGTSVRSGRAAFEHARHEHTETSPAMTGGDVDADWEDAYAVGDEAPGGDNPTPGQDRVDDIGRSLGVQYQDNEELKPADKIIERDKHRWELDPASSEDYKERERK